MHSLMLLGWLAAAAAEPVVIEVPTHALASATAPKRQAAPATDLVAQAAHAMSARVDADGRIHYHCADAAATHDFRVGVRAPRKEQ
jgi:hypothetical protein